MGEDEDGPSRALVALLQPLCSDAWVQCDHCELWRRVPKEVSERLGDDEQWYAPPSLPRTHLLVPADAVRRLRAVRRASRGRATASRVGLSPRPVFPGPDRRDRGTAPPPRRARAPALLRPPPRPSADARDLVPSLLYGAFLPLLRLRCTALLSSSLPKTDHALTRSDSLVPLRPLRAGSAS